MNEFQKEVLKSQINYETVHLNWLKAIYEQAAKDTAKKIAELSAQASMNPQNLQSIIYRQKYQEAILTQIQKTLADLHKTCYNGISDYLNQCYETGYIGAMYDLHRQGIPVVMPIDQKQVRKAIELDSKLSKCMYKRLGEDINHLKRKVKAEVSRGIVEGKSWNEVAERLAHSMNSPFKVAKNNAMRIARTEGHRVQCEAQMDACNHAKSKGADVVKQWDSTLDGRTRPSHKRVDGEIRELNESFSNGLLMPSDPKGHPAEVINCRCALLQRAKWNLGESELQTLQDRAEFFGLDKADSFEEFKEKYLKLPKDSDNIKTETQRVPNAISSILDNNGVAYNQVLPHSTTMTEEDIIRTLAGLDKTQGSCASVGLAYCGQKCGYDVLDFRDGVSRGWFSSKTNKIKMWDELGIKYTTENSYKTNLANGNKILKQVQNGHEYYLSVGSHASVVRRTDEGVLQYLELQAPLDSTSWLKGGWTDFAADPRTTLKYRFGCTSSSCVGCAAAYLTDIEDMKENDAFIDILGYINTSVGKEVKGLGGSIK